MGHGKVGREYRYSTMKTQCLDDFQESGRPGDQTSEQVEPENVDVLWNVLHAARDESVTRTREGGDAREQVKKPRISFSGEFHERGRTG